MKKIWSILFLGMMALAYPASAQEETADDNSSECITKESIYFEYYKGVKPSHPISRSTSHQ